MTEDAPSAVRQPVLLLDALTVVAAMGSAYAAHHALHGVVPFIRVPPPYAQYATVAVLAVPIWLILTVFLELDRIYDRTWTAAQLVVRLLKLHGAGFTALAMLVFVTQSIVNRSLMALFLAFSFVLMLAGRLALLQWRRHQYQTGLARERWLVVGSPGARLRAVLADVGTGDFPPQIIGRLDDAPDGTDAGGPAAPPRLGGLDALGRLLGQEAVDLVVFFSPHHDPALVPEALLACEQAGVPAAFPLALGGQGRAAPIVLQLRGHPSVVFDVVAKPRQLLAFKHAADFLVGLCAIVLLAPIMLLIAVVLWARDGRPVLFVQERAGLHGRSFRMLKFRTMAHDAERQRDELLGRNEMNGPVFKVKHDPRVTKLGRLLRRFSLDELPQLFNVLVGEMSLVGPRPLPTGERRQIAGPYRRRLSMKPGITGLWQVSGRSDVDFDEWMRLDLAYVDDWSLGGDVRILARTLGAVLRGRGAW